MVLEAGDCLLWCSAKLIRAILEQARQIQGGSRLITNSRFEGAKEAQFRCR